MKRRLGFRQCAILGLLVSCGESAPMEKMADKMPPSPKEEMIPKTKTPQALKVVPGVSVGEVVLGMSLQELTAALGQPDNDFSFNRLVTYQYLDERIEVLLSSADRRSASEDAEVVALGTLPGATIEAPLKAEMTPAELESKFGEPGMQQGDIAYFPPSGLGVKYNKDGNVERFTVWPSFNLDTEPPEMELAASTMPTTRDRPVTGEPIKYEMDGEFYDVVDMHLHVGRNPHKKPSGVEFLLSQLPGSAALYFPATSDPVLDPYAKHLGIKEHLNMSGVGHGVLLATYTHHTIGFAQNRLLETYLDDSRNKNPDGSQWAWGLASINFDGFDAPALAQQRLAALSSYFEKRPDLFIGIKLAHAHQAVSFEDPVYLSVYDVAAQHSLPVLLHTGFSPFPNTKTEPEFYDPQSLEAVIQAYSGEQGQGRVDFVLAHVGQGDARAIEHSLQLAEKYDNVWLEISAINRPLLIDIDGEPVDDNTPMHPYVLGQIKDRDLVNRTIFASDGPQYFGKVDSYLQIMGKTMKDAGYTTEDIRRVLAGSFYDCFFTSQ